MLPLYVSRTLLHARAPAVNPTRAAPTIIALQAKEK
jgi:hypothetical protein